MPTGVNLNKYAGPGSLIRWLEFLFGPQNSPKLVVSLSLRNSVEVIVRRRAPGKVPSSIRGFVYLCSAEYASKAHWEPTMLP